MKVEEATLATAIPLQRTIRQLKEGLPFAAFETLRDRLGVPAKELAEVVHIAARTLARRKEEGRLHTDESDRLLRVSRLFDQAVELFEQDFDRARDWFTSPCRALGGVSPLHYADTEPGGREVEDLIGRLEHGVFS